jgi:hypothetical protein
LNYQGSDDLLRYAAALERGDIRIRHRIPARLLVHHRDNDVIADPGLRKFNDGVVCEYLLRV